MKEKNKKSRHLRLKPGFSMALLGAPGSGKARLAQRLAEQFGIRRIVFNDLIPVPPSDDGESPQRWSHSEASHVPGDHVLADALLQRLLHDEGSPAFLLDGFPRTVEQARTFDTRLAAVGRRLDLVVYIEADGDLLLQTLAGRRTCMSCGVLFNIYINPPIVDDVCDYCGGRLRHRAEDNEETIANRLRVFEMHSVPLLEYYLGREVLRRVDASLTPDRVFEEVVDILRSPPVGQDDLPPAVSALESPARDSATESEQQSVKAAAGVSAWRKASKRPRKEKNSPGGRQAKENGETSKKKVQAQPPDEAGRGGADDSPKGKKRSKARGAKAVRVG